MKTYNHLFSARTNFVWGKCVERLDLRGDFSLVFGEKQIQKEVAKPAFADLCILSSDVGLVKKWKSKIYENRYAINANWHCL